MADGGPGGSVVRWAGAAGIVFAVIFIAGAIFIGGTPNYDAGDDEWVRWFNDSGHRAQQIIGAFLMVAAALVFVAFAIVLLKRARARGGNDVMSTVAGAVAVIFASILMAAGVIQAAVSGAMTFAPDSFPAPSADIERVLEQLGVALLLVAGGWTAAAFVAAATHVLKGAGVAPSWLVWAGYVVAVLLLASVAFFPLVLLPLWAAAVGISILRDRSPSGAGRWIEEATA